MPFFRRYVQRSERLPLREYYGKLGIVLVEDSTGTPTRFGVMENPTPDQLRLRSAWLGRRMVIP